MRSTFSTHHLTARRSVVGAFAGLVLLGAASQASAAVVTVFGVSSNLILAGEQSIVDVQLGLSFDAGFFFAAFTGGNVTLFSGDGQSQLFDIGSGGTFRDFSQAFTYSDPGSYFANFTASYTANEFAQTCVPGGGCVTTSVGIGGQLNGGTAVVVEPTPLPAAFPLFASGLGLMGWFARRKKRRAAA
jgi:hypothetical protein